MNIGGNEWYPYNCMYDVHVLHEATVLPHVCEHEFFILDGTRCKTIIGAVDYAWLFTYAIFMVGRSV